MVGIISCTCWPFVCPLWNNVCSVSLPNFLNNLGFLVFLYILRLHRKGNYGRHEKFSIWTMKMELISSRSIAFVKHAAITSCFHTITRWQQWNGNRDFQGQKQEDMWVLLLAYPKGNSGLISIKMLVRHDQVALERSLWFQWAIQGTFKVTGVYSFVKCFTRSAYCSLAFNSLISFSLQPTATTSGE